MYFYFREKEKLREAGGGEELRAFRRVRRNKKEKRNLPGCDAKLVMLGLHRENVEPETIADFTRMTLFASVFYFISPLNFENPVRIFFFPGEEFTFENFQSIPQSFKSYRFH